MIKVGDIYQLTDRLYDYQKGCLFIVTNIEFKESNHPMIDNTEVKVFALDTNMQQHRIWPITIEKKFVKI